MEPWLVRIRNEQLATFDRINQPMAEWLRAVDGLYLFGTIGMEAVLRADGAVWVSRADRWPESDEHTWRPATDLERYGALVIASRRHAELAQLLPPQPPDAPACARCTGSGFLFGDDQTGVLCPDCGGLGWVVQAAT